MPHVTVMAALKLGNPVTVFVSMKANNRPLHNAGITIRMTGVQMMLSTGGGWLCASRKEAAERSE